MGSKSPLHGLFPDKNNVTYIEPRNQQKNGKTAISRPIYGDHKSRKDSLESDTLRSIINEEGWNNIDTYHESVRNDRFYLTDRYNRKKSIHLTDMLKQDDESKYEGQLNDFTDYNRKIRKEYVLRDKTETILRNVDQGLLPVFTEDILENVFSSSTFEEGTSPKLIQRDDKGEGASIYVSDMPSKYGDDIKIKTNSSLSTFIIDEAGYGNMIIDENNRFKLHTKVLDNVSTDDEITDVRHSRRIFSWKGIVDRYILGNNQDSKYHVQRKLTVRHIQMLSIGPCLSVGFFLNTGKAFAIGGPFGALLGFVLAGSVVLATLLSFVELATFIPVSSGFSGLASRFVEDAFGFGIGWTYFISCLISFPAEAASSTFYLTYYRDLNFTPGVIAGFVTLFLAIPIALNLMSVNIMGESVFFFGVFKILVSTMMIFVLLILNSGYGGLAHKQVGFRFWDSSKSVGDMTYGLFRPTFDLKDAGTGSTRGIGGAAGRFISLISVMLTSTYAYSGVEMTFLASGEAINPRKSLPSAIKRTFSFILSIYFLSIIAVGINIYSGDPRLLTYYTDVSSERAKAAANGIGTSWQLYNTCAVRNRISVSTVDYYSSPWVLALQSFGLCTFAASFNAILIIFTTSAGIASLFNSSRSLYSMSVQRKAPYIFSICNRRGVPYVSVIFSSLSSVIAYLAVNRKSQNNFTILVNMSSASTSIIWFGLNLSFLRFYYALRKRKDFISRDTESYPFKSPFQPYLAFYGLFGCFMFILFMGFTNFMHGFWTTGSFFSAYGGLMIFGISYFSYKIFSTSKIQRLDHLDMDTGRREMDRIIWTEHRQYTSNTLRGRIKALLSLFG